MLNNNITQIFQKSIFPEQIFVYKSMIGCHSQAAPAIKSLLSDIKQDFKANYQATMISYDSPAKVPVEKLRWAIGFLTLQNEYDCAQHFIKQHSDYKMRNVSSVKVIQSDWIDQKEDMFKEFIPNLYKEAFTYCYSQGLLSHSQNACPSIEIYSPVNDGFRLKIMIPYGTNSMGYFVCNS